MADLYETLGVSKNASNADLKKAYRKLAMENHPDRGGDQDRFAEISNAYETLKDPQKRAAYDHFGTADPQQQQAQQGPFSFHFSRGGAHPGNPFDLDSIFEMFGQRMNRGPQRPPDARIQLVLDLPDAVRGGKKVIGVQTNTGQSSIEVDIPPGIVDNESVRYPGLAPGGMDLVVNYRVRAHPLWQRDGLDLYCERDIDIWKLILGYSLPIVDILGRSYDLTVPPRTNPGATMRLRGRGIKRDGHNTGDLFVRLKATMPKEIPNEIIDVIAKHQGQ